MTTTQLLAHLTVGKSGMQCAWLLHVETASADELKRDLGFIPEATLAKGNGGHQHHHG